MYYDLLIHWWQNSKCSLRKVTQNSALIAQFPSFGTKRKELRTYGFELGIRFFDPCWHPIFNKVTFCYCIGTANVGEIPYHHSAPWERVAIGQPRFISDSKSISSEHIAQFLPHNSRKFSVIISFSLINLVLIEGSWISFCLSFIIQRKTISQAGM